MAADVDTNRHGASSIHFDVLVIGAGLSGIDAAYRLQTECPGKTFAILEARSAIGGTWDLFRYPGVRSDSDMATLGFPFRPWTQEESIAGGDKIVGYIRDTAQMFGIDRHIRFNHRAERAAWSSEDGRWTVDVTVDGQTTRFSCGLLYMCSGYYRYDQGYSPEFPGLESFGGQVVHPQFWPENLDYAGKKIVVIGSGATAMTLAPSLAASAAHVTMLQRSPTYVVSIPSRDVIAKRLRRRLPAKLAEPLIRWKNILFSLYAYQSARKKPEQAKQYLMEQIRKTLVPEVFDAEHFTPRYNPWDQRLCLVPDADLFIAMNERRVSIVTDQIETFTPTGVKLRSGKTLEADIVITATGLVLQVLGGVEMTVDGAPATISGRVIYKGMMADGIPNMAFSFGYTNASWTLKCDLTAQYLCRVLNYMDRTGQDIFTPHQRDPAITQEPMMALQSGYVQRSEQFMPRQGSKAPWRVHQNYVLDLAAVRYGKIDDGVMEFRKSSRSTARKAAAA